MKKVNIIAECCQNHNGDKETLKKMIHTAAEHGADYVKIQAIRSKDLSFRERFEKGKVDKTGKVLVIKRPYEQELERLAKLDLSLEEEFWFVNECKTAGVSPMTTVFNRTSVNEVKNMGYDAIKIASYDCASIPLLKDVKNNWNKIFVSTGATYDNEIQSAVDVLKGSDFELLHCVTIYPTPLNELHLNRIKFLSKFANNIGYSDHSKPATTGLWASKIALAMGASSIERHYTILEEHETKDGPVSINPSMVKELRIFADFDNQKQWDIIKKDFTDWEITMGNANRELSHNELLNRDYYRGRFSNKINNKETFNWQ
jgi:sialic acid synthase SpsE